MPNDLPYRPCVGIMVLNRDEACAQEQRRQSPSNVIILPIQFAHATGVALLKARVCGDAFRGRLFAGGGAAAKPSGEQVPPKTAVYCGAGTDYAASSGIIKS